MNGVLLVLFFCSHSTQSTAVAGKRGLPSWTALGPGVGVSMGDPRACPVRSGKLFVTTWPKEETTGCISVPYAGSQMWYGSVQVLKGALWKGLVLFLPASKSHLLRDVQRGDAGLGEGQSCFNHISWLQTF